MIKDMPQGQITDVIQNFERSYKQCNLIDHPSHYCQGSIECIDAMEAAFGKEALENYCICNAFKFFISKWGPVSP